MAKSNQWKKKSPPTPTSPDALEELWGGESLVADAPTYYQVDAELIGQFVQEVQAVGDVLTFYSSPQRGYIGCTVMHADNKHPFRFEDAESAEDFMQRMVQKLRAQEGTTEAKKHHGGSNGATQGQQDQQQQREVPPNAGVDNAPVKNTNRRGKSRATPVAEPGGTAKGSEVVEDLTL